MYVWSTLSCVNVRLRLRASSSLPGSTMFYCGEDVCRAPWNQGVLMLAQKPPQSSHGCSSSSYHWQPRQTKMPFPADWLQLNSSVGQPFLASGPRWPEGSLVKRLVTAGVGGSDRQ